MSDELLKIAIDHHRAGRLRQAEGLYGEILEREPANVDAMHGLGMIALQAGRSDQAVEIISRVVELRPTSVAFQSNLGMAYQACKQYPQAEAAFHRAIALAPDVASIHFNLANVVKEQKRLSEAVELYLKVIQLQADQTGAYNNLGNCYNELGRLDEARHSLMHAIRLRPEYAEAHQNLANVLINLGQPIESEACARETIRLQPQFGAAYVSLGTALFAQKKFEEASQAFRRATELSPTLAEAHENLGMTLVEQGRLSDGIASFRRAVEVAPRRAESWRRLGNAFMTRRQFTPGDQCYRRAAEIEPDDLSSQSQWLFWKLYRPEVSLLSIAARHADWNARLRTQSIENLAFQGRPPRDGNAEGEDGEDNRLTNGRRQIAASGKSTFESRLRLGFVSADFGQHPVGMFTIRTLEALSSLGFEIVCYSTNPRTGSRNDRFRKCVAQWREVRQIPDEALANLIAADRIDILIDLAGHSAGNRLGVFALAPAPVQATWIGSEGTTGLSAMDYLIADERVVPREAEPFYSEQIIRLPVSYVSWDPPAEAPEVAPLPAASGGPVTFGSFNNPAKYHSHLAGLWSRILDRVPGSRLVLQSRHLSDQTLRGNLIGLFRKYHVDVSRLEFREWQPYSKLLESYHEIDIALDPFPFGGGATTCEALWMGVPVVTWPGETFSSRHSCSYLTSIGLSDLIAATEDEYVEIPVALAHDLDRLSGLRRTLRTQIESSPLCDGQLCARDLATILRQIWSEGTCREKIHVD